MDQTINEIGMECENCNGPHLTKDYDLDENGNRKVQACYLSGDTMKKTGGSPKRNGYLMMNTRKPKKKR